MVLSSEPEVAQMSLSKKERAIGSRPLPPPDVFDPVIEAYKKDVDRTLLRENLKLTPQQRSEQFEQMMEMVFELQRQARARREQA